jgi:hypothetical protein
MSNANPSFGAQRLGAGSTSALNLTQYAGEVLEAFEARRIMRDLIRTRSISGAKSAQFPAFFKAWAGIHTPGNELLGQDIQKTDVTVTVDGLLIHDVYVDRIDEMLTHYDLRGPYARAQGEGIARVYDVMASQLVAKATDAAELFAGDGGGGKVTQSGTQDFTKSGLDLIDALAAAKLSREALDVDVDNLNAIFMPLQWSLIANSDKNINRDYGDSNIRNPSLDTMVGVRVHKSNAFAFGKDVTPYNAGTNADGLVGHPTDIRRLPATLNAKYHRDMSKTVGLVFSDEAAAMLHVLDLNTEATWDPRRRATLLVAEMAAGGDVLRGKCAVEIKLP